MVINYMAQAQAAEWIAYLRENVTEREVQAAFDAATTVSNTPEADRAKHLQNQVIPSLKLYGILHRIKLLLEVSDEGV